MKIKLLSFLFKIHYTLKNYIIYIDKFNNHKGNFQFFFYIFIKNLYFEKIHVYNFIYICKCTMIISYYNGRIKKLIYTNIYI